MKQLIVACVLSLFAASAWCEPTAKAVYDANTTILTFYYDENTYEGDGVTQYGMNSGTTDPGWAFCAATTAVFNAEFANYKPTCVYRWFYNMPSLLKIDGLTNLDTTNITSMRRMFQKCGKITELDLSSFDTANVRDVREMFAGCSSLTRIYVGDLWNDENFGDGTNMFSSCSSLVGVNGTVYDSNYTDARYAHVDGGQENPGYLTLKNSEVPPTIKSVAVSGIGQTNATVTVEGSGLADGEVTVELRIEDETVALSTKPAFGAFEFYELMLSTTYDVRVVATNVYGAVTNDTQSFTTLGEVGDCWVYDAGAGTMSWSEWVFAVTLAKDGTLQVGAVTKWPDVAMALDFSLPVKDGNGTVYVISDLSPAFGHHDNASSYKPAGYEPQCLRVGLLTLPGEGLITIGTAAFAACANATGVVSFPSTVTTIGSSAFADCPSLQIDGSTIPGGVTLISQYCFRGDKAMFGDLVLTNVTEVADSAFQETAITSVKFGPGLTKIGGNYKRGAIQDCKSLTNLVFDATSKARIFTTFTFQNCSSLEELDLRGVVDFSLTSGTSDRCDYSHISGCTKLKKIIFGAGLTNLTCNAMAGATALEEVVFEGVPPVSFQTPYLSATNNKGEHVTDYDNQKITTYVHRKLCGVKNEAGKCWNDYAKDGIIDAARKNPANNSTWAAEFVVEGVDLANRQLLTLEPNLGLLIIIR